jgi:hypothetical protein
MYSKKVLLSKAEWVQVINLKKNCRTLIFIDTVIKYKIPDTCILNIYKSFTIYDMKSDYFLLAYSYP